MAQRIQCDHNEEGHNNFYAVWVATISKENSASSNAMNNSVATTSSAVINPVAITSSAVINPVATTVVVSQFVATLSVATSTISNAL
ncbi:hypothetical protein Sjap_013304 [Stephania japonica]|uniref:Uncharacterized protein n=1 Tax=Stephania japonica TaxID=461633 RepID=A0AAP0IXI3_9MAGN